MKNMPPFTFGTLLCLTLVIGGAASARAWYLMECADNGQRAPALRVQGPPAMGGAERDELVENLLDRRAFECRAPLARNEETTAHVAPGYPVFLALIGSPDADSIVRWVQCALGTLTSMCYFFFARRAFHSTFIATLAGLLTAFHPFWVINTAEVNDGVLASFFLGLCLALGARGGQVGGLLTGFAFGLALAGAALFRPALLPFALVTLLWFLWQCRRYPLGWFAGFLALLGFVNGIGPWAIHNYLVFDRPIPVVDSTYLHLWMGNNSQSTGSTLDKEALQASLSTERLDKLLDEPNQAKRYNMLASDVCQEVQDHPTETLMRRIKAALVFLLGERWFKSGQLGAVVDEADDIAELPDWLQGNAEAILHSVLAGLVVLAFLGWRSSFPWRRYGRIGVLALLFIPLPYVLSHAEAQSGPRLPLDGVLLCYAAYALAGLIPGLIRSPGAVSK